MAEEDINIEIKQEPGDTDTGDTLAWRVLWELPAQESYCGDDQHPTASSPANPAEDLGNTKNRKLSPDQMKQFTSMSVKSEPEDINDYESADPVSQRGAQEEDCDEMMNFTVVKSEPSLFDESTTFSAYGSSSKTREGRSSMKRGLEQNHAYPSKKTKPAMDASASQRPASSSYYPLHLIESRVESETANTSSSGSPASKHSTSCESQEHGDSELAAISERKGRDKTRGLEAEVYLDNAEDDSGDSVASDCTSPDFKTRRDCIVKQDKGNSNQGMAQSTQAEHVQTGDQEDEQNCNIMSWLHSSIDAEMQSKEEGRPVKEKLTKLLKSRGKNLSIDSSTTLDSQLNSNVVTSDNLHLSNLEHGKVSPRKAGVCKTKPVASLSTVCVDGGKGSNAFRLNLMLESLLLKDDARKASDSKHIVYEGCPCTTQSFFERGEVEAWRMVKLPGKGYDTSVQMQNIGLVRFMNRPLFTFTKDDKLYVYLAEVKFKKLLPLFEHEQSYILSESKLQLIAPEMRKPSLIEQAYVDNYIYMEPGHWTCVMITPHGLHSMYQLLHKMKKAGIQPQPLRWYKHAHSLFYLQKLGHHCPWTLLVTPPTGSEPAKKRASYVSNSVYKVMKTLTRVHWDPESKKTVLKEVKLCDGGAGTAIDSHHLSPMLGAALSSVIKMFDLEDIAQPFCTCSLNVSDSHLYQPLTINYTVFRHITQMSFVDFPSPLHCWKRSNGFFISYVEFCQKTLLPPLGNTDVENLLRAAIEGTDVCFMLEPEMLFLTKVHVSKGGRRTVNPDTVDAIIARARDRMHVKNVKKGRYKNSTARSNNLGLLISLVYLRKMYIQLAKKYAWLRPHAEAKFLIKHWPHDCLSEKDSSFSPSANENAGDEGDVLDSLEHSDVKDASNPSSVQSADDEDDEMDDKTDDEKDDGKEDMEKEDNLKSVEYVDDDDDVEMLENVEEEKEVIDLVDMSSDEDNEDSGFQHEPHEPPQARTSRDQVSEAKILRLSAQEKSEEQTKPRILAGQKETKQAAHLKKEVSGPEPDRDLYSTSHRLGLAGSGSTSYGLEDVHHSRTTAGNLEVSTIKQERQGEEMDAEQFDLSHIKHEVTDTDEYFSNLPIAIVADVQDSQIPGQQTGPVSTAEPSTEEKHDANIIQQIKREQRDQTLKPVASMQKVKEEVGSDDDNDSSDEEALSFNPETFPRSCNCPEDSEKSVLTSQSILQSSINQRNSITILNNVGHAIIGDNLVYTFIRGNTIYMNVGQLQDLGFIKQNVQISSFTHQGPVQWLQKASGFEVNFLMNNGITMNTTRAYLLSVELLSFLSYERRSVVRCMIRKSDICLHRIGHICTKDRSIARHVLNNSLYLDIVMQAWAKSFYWQDKLKEVEHRRLAGTQPPLKVKHDTSRHKTAIMERAVTSTEPPQCAESTGKKQKAKSKFTKAETRCAIYLRKYKISDLDVSEAAAKSQNFKSTFYVCSPNFNGGVSIVKRKTVRECKKVNENWKARLEEEEKEGETTDDTRDCQTNVLEGAMLPKLFKDKNQCLKSGVGFAELDTVAIQKWIGNKSDTHHIVLTGTLTTGIREDGDPFTFSCMRVKDKLYINWGELCSQMVGICTIYRLAKQLHIFLYTIPTILGLHFSRHYGSCMDTMSTKPWLCVNSVNAVAWLGVIDTVSCNMFPKTFALLAEHFQNTDNWNLQFRNFLLIPKEEFVPV